MGIPTKEFDLVVTLCDHANETCPFFAGAIQKIHQAFDDPPRLAATTKTEEEAMAHYRGVRDAIGEFVESLFRNIDRFLANF